MTPSFLILSLNHLSLFSFLSCSPCLSDSMLDSLFLLCLVACVLLASLLHCACFYSQRSVKMDNKERYFSVICRNRISVCLFSSRLVSPSSPSAPAMMVFYKNKTSAISPVRQLHSCNYKVARFLSCMRVCTPRARHIDSVPRSPDPFLNYSYIG